MGQDKSRLRLGRKSLLSLIRQSVEDAGFQCRVIERDLVPKCGPLAGILTGLLTSSADWEMFLACDMPFITAGTLQSLVSRQAELGRPVFSITKAGVGFPCLLPASCLPVVEMQIQQKQFSLQQLARVCGAGTFALPASEALNLNTPADLAAAKEFLAKRVGSSRTPKKPRKSGL
jgi:molybdopterin-guanine dinucleotide biosynthesis protein A